MAVPASALVALAVGAAVPVMRWRVKASRHTPTWFHAVEVRFLDATDAHQAKAMVEAESVEGNELRVWAVTPATDKMEADYRAWQAKCELWRATVAAHGNPRGIL